MGWFFELAYLRMILRSLLTIFALGGAEDERPDNAELALMGWKMEEIDR